jgi:hypothetical protein
MFGPTIPLPFQKTEFLRNDNSVSGVSREKNIPFISIQVFLSFFCGVQNPSVGADLPLHKARCTGRYRNSSRCLGIDVPRMIGGSAISANCEESAVFLDFRKQPVRWLWLVNRDGSGPQTPVSAPAFCLFGSMMYLLPRYLRCW